MSEANKELVRRAWAAYDAGDAEAFAACVAPDWREYGTPDPSDGFYTLDDERRTMESHKVAFPDKHTELHHLVAEGDYVASSCTVRATHTGPYMGLAPTGKRVELYEMMINRIRDGRISESWAISTGKGFFEQLTGETAPEQLDNMG